MRELIELAQKIQDLRLREQVISFLNNPSISIPQFGDELDIEAAPASKAVHHSYERGLIEHILSVTHIALEIVNVIEKIYKIDFVNRDVIIAGALLHDIYKPLTYSKDGQKYERSRLGSKIDHTSLIFAEAWSRKFPLEVLHVILAHHGKGAPAQPRSLEAVIVHLADYVDSEIMNDVLLGAKKIVKRTGKTITVDNSRFAAMICQVMAKDGIKGVEQFLSKSSKD
jgi:7,8-dihydroneopterin 2',3'-cyclic phosphate phosphodiesterase